MKHFLNTQDWTRAELDAVLAQAAAFKRSKAGDQLKGKSIALVFFNPSLRTRTSSPGRTVEAGLPGRNARPRSSPCARPSGFPERGRRGTAVTIPLHAVRGMPLWPTRPRQQSPCGRGSSINLLPLQESPCSREQPSAPGC